MVLNTKVNGIYNKIYVMVKAYKFIVMDPFMKGIGKMITEMEEAD
jgi:hypothetical protein